MSLKTKHPFDEEFIPDGLEFKESYMQQAMGLYDNAKKLLFWKKLAIISSSAAALIAGAFVYMAFFSTPKNDQNIISSLPKTEQSFGSDEVNTSSSSSPVDGSTDEPKSTTNTPDDKRVLPQNAPSNIDKRELPTERKRKGSSSYTDNFHSELTKTNTEFTPQSNNPSEATIEKENRFTYSLGEQTSDVQIDSKPATILSSSEKLSALNELKTLQHSFPPLSPSLSPTTPLSTARHRTDVKAKPWMFYVGSGLSATNGYATTRIASSLNPSAEVGIQSYLGGSFTGSVGLTFQSIGGLHSPIAFVQKEYGSGLTETNTLIHTNRLYYAGIRPQINWGLNEKWDVSASYQLDYLITGTNTISTQVSSTFDQPQTKAQKTSGYVAGFKDLNHSIAFGTIYHLGQKQAIGLLYQQGLTDITRNTFFGEKRDLNSMLTLQYRFYFS